MYTISLNNMRDESNNSMNKCIPGAQPTRMRPADKSGPRAAYLAVFAYVRVRGSVCVCVRV